MSVINLLSVEHAQLYTIGSLQNFNTALNFRTAVSHDYSLETSFAGNGRSWTDKLPHGDVKVSVTLFALLFFSSLVITTINIVSILQTAQDYVDLTQSKPVGTSLLYQAGGVQSAMVSVPKE